MKVWLRQHGFALRHALHHLGARSGFLLNVLVVAIALALPFAGLTLLENVRPVSGQLAVEPEISIFLAMDTPREAANALAPKIGAIVQNENRSGKLEFVSRDNALTALQARGGMADVVTTLGHNPLPDVYVLQLTGVQNADDAGRIEAIAAQLKALPGVDYVQVDSAWVKRLTALLQILRVALGLLAFTLGVVVVAVVFNTVRLQVMNQRDEIEVARLVGATDAFIYRPFYYTGALLGVCAGALAMLAVVVSLHPLNDAIGEFARLYASEFRLVPLGIGPTVALLAISAILGLIGSYLSVRRHLARLD